MLSMSAYEVARIMCTILIERMGPEPLIQFTILLTSSNNPTPIPPFNKYTPP